MTVLVVAKAPVPGRVKTRLAADVGDRVAARLASAALLDTIAAAVEAVGTARCRLALEGDLTQAVDGSELVHALAGWTIVPQCGGALGERLAHAHAGVRGPVVQIGMDTPQVTAGLLADVLTGLDRSDAVLAPAMDGGWWALGLRDGAACAPLRDVPMSTPTTYDDTRRALKETGLRVAGAPLLTDVDRLADAVEVARAAPGSRFAAALEQLGVRS